MPSTPPTSAHQGASQGQNGSNSSQPQADTVPSDQSPADEKIPDFDWDDLLIRYHKVMEARNAEEEKVYAEFASLINVTSSKPRTSTPPDSCISVSPSGHTRCPLMKLIAHTSGRILQSCHQLPNTYALVYRLRTRIEHVQHSEDQLEQKRQHCMFLPRLHRGLS